MLEYLYQTRGSGGLDFAGWKLPSLPVSLAILNGFFLFLYVILRIFGDGSMGLGLAIFILLAMAAANVVIYLLLTTPF
jgi:hypothetical protein